MKIYANKNYWYSSGYLFTFFAAWALWWSFYSIWLKNDIGLTSKEIGYVYSINSAVAMFFMIFYGVIQDKIQTGKAVIIFQSIVMIVIGPFLIYVYEPLLHSHYLFAAIIGAPVLSASFISGSALLESFIERISRLYDFEFGIARFWGSFGYAISALIAGITFGINPHINFWLASIVAFFFFLINLKFKPKHYNNSNQKQDISVIKTSSVPKISDIVSILGFYKFWVFVFFIIGTYSFYTVYDQQLFPPFYTQFFSSSEIGYKVYGYLNSFQVFLEAGCMMLVPYFINKIGAKNALILAAFIMICRIALSGTLDNVYLISMIKLLHAIEIPLFILAMFKYVVINFDERLSATLYLVGFNISSNIGVILFSAPIGLLRDNTNYSQTFYVLASTVLFVTVISYFTLSNKTKCTS